MKIAVMSDVHLEFGQLTVENPEGADVLILSGDICVSADIVLDVTCYGHGVGTKSQRFHDFFQEVTGKFKDVIYVCGNHEFYHGDFATGYARLKENLSYLKNLHILDDETVKIGDVTFIGGTLWTDMNNEDPLTLYHMRDMMNDFRIVKNSNRTITYEDDSGRMPMIPRFQPEDAVDAHKKTFEYIKTVLANDPDGKFVIVTHHAPSRQSTHPRYANDTIMNGGYSSHLDFFIEDHPQIALWTHGHTHEPFDYNIGMTRIVCNPRGYVNYEKRASDFQVKVVEV